MRRHGIERALIYHVQAEDISPTEGNRALETWTHDDNSFSLQWVAGPGPESLRQLQGLHAAGKVKCIRLHNSNQARIPFVDWIYGDLIEWLHQERIPLWVSLEDTQPKEIMAALRPFPDLVTVLLGAHYSHAMMVRPFLRNLPNSFLELSRYETLGGTEDLIQEFGVERFIYGSFYPRYALGPMLYYLHQMKLDDAELTAVCSGNLTRILGETG